MYYSSLTTRNFELLHELKINERLNSINDFDEIEPTLKKILNDLKNTNIVEKFLSNEWNNRGFKYITDRDNKKVKCKKFRYEKDNYKKTELSTERTDIKLYYLQKPISYIEYKKRRLNNEYIPPEYLTIYLNDSEFIEIPNKSKIYYLFIYNGSIENYKVKVITDEINDERSVLVLKLYLKLENYLKKYHIPVSNKIKYFFREMQKAFIDSVDEYKKVLNLIRIALESGNDTVLRSKLFTFYFEDRMRFNSLDNNSFFFEDDYHLSLNGVTRWDYLHLRNEIESLIKLLSVNTSLNLNEESTNVKTKKIKLNITPTQLTELVMALIENQNFKKQDYESEKKLYNYLYEVFEISPHSFETTKTKLRDRQKEETFLTNLDRSFKTAIKRLREKQD